jgi:hypothetical protein
LLLSIDLKYRDIWKVEENLVGGRNERISPRCFKFGTKEAEESLMGVVV